MEQKFIRKKVEVASLLNRTIDYLQFMKLSNEHDEYYQFEAGKFGHYEVPTITNDNRVLTHIEDVEMALVNNVKEIEVMQAYDLSEDDLPRFCMKGIYFKKLEEADRYRLIVMLKEHLQINPKGIEWSNEFERKGINDINRKLGIILNCDRSTITNTMANYAQPQPKEKPIRIAPKNIKVSVEMGLPVITYKGKNYATEDIRYKSKNGQKVITITFTPFQV